MDIEEIDRIINSHDGIEVNYSLMGIDKNSLRTSRTRVVRCQGQTYSINYHEGVSYLMDGPRVILFDDIIIGNFCPCYDTPVVNFYYHGQKVFITPLGGTKDLKNCAACDMTDICIAFPF